MEWRFRWRDPRVLDRTHDYEYISERRSKVKLVWTEGPSLVSPVDSLISVERIILEILE